MHRRTTTTASVTALTALLALSACSAIGGDDGGSAGADPGAGTGDGGEVTLVTHDSFVLRKGVERAFEEQTGIDLTVTSPGDAGILVNQLVLSKDAPLGDVVYGIDNAFGSRAVGEGVLADGTEVPADAEDAEAPELADLAVPGGDGALVPVDYSDVCLNVDTAWFDEEGLAPPRTFEDLLDPAYADLTVVTDPASSSPGLAFLLATVAQFGEDGWRDYWSGLRDNGVLVDASWSDAYYSDFTGGGGEGDRPVVLSYASSPPYTVPDGGTRPTTRALLDTCFRQVEYAGVLEGAANPEGAQEVVDLLLSPDFQETLPTAMYVYPARDDVALPTDWQRYAPLADDPLTMDPQTIEDNRDRWIDEWTATVVD